jgi:PPOX class probable F420-dependent enzyme
MTTMITNTSQSERLSKLTELIEDIRIAMLTTTIPDGTLRSRPMATQRAESDGDLWFFTQASAAKAEEIRANPHVNVSYTSPRENRYVSISGTATIVRDRRKREELWDQLYRAWFPQGLEDLDLALLRVDVERAEYWDAPSGTMAEIAGLLKATTTGQAHLRPAVLILRIRRSPGC